MKSLKLAHGGFSLTELLVATTLATLLAGGLASALGLVGSALRPDNPTRRAASAARVLAILRDDLRTAISFSELTSNVAEFQVPDRDGDDLPETLRYALGGTNGNDLVYEYTSSTGVSDGEQTLLESVQSFELTFHTRELSDSAAGGTP